MVFEGGVGGEMRKREETEIEAGSGNVKFTEMSVICQRAEITLVLFFFLFSLQSLWSGECHRVRGALFSQAQDEYSREEMKKK